MNDTERLARARLALWWIADNVDPALPDWAKKVAQSGLDAATAPNAPKCPMNGVPFDVAQKLIGFDDDGEPSTAEGLRMADWVKCTDDVPVGDGFVLACRAHGRSFLDIVSARDVRHYTAEATRLEEELIWTHWMPLPAPPQVENSAGGSDGS